MYTYVHMNSIPVNATTARNIFFDLINSVFTENKVYEIKKSGITVAFLSKASPTTKTPKSLLKAVENLPESNKNLDSKEIIDYIYSSRSDSNTTKRKLPDLE